MTAQTISYTPTFDVTDKSLEYYRRALCSTRAYLDFRIVVTAVASNRLIMLPANTRIDVISIRKTKDCLTVKFTALLPNNNNQTITCTTKHVNLCGGLGLN